MKIHTICLTIIEYSIKMECVRYDSTIYRELDIVNNAAYEKYLQGGDIYDDIIPVALTHYGYDVTIDIQNGGVLENGKYHVIKYSVGNNEEGQEHQEGVFYYSEKSDGLGIFTETHFDVNKHPYRVSNSQYIYIKDEKLHCTYDYAISIDDKNIDRNGIYRNYFYKGAYCVSASHMISNHCADFKNAIRKDTIALVSLYTGLYKDVISVIINNWHILECYLFCNPYNIPNDIADEILDRIESEKRWDAGLRLGPMFNEGDDEPGVEYGGNGLEGQEGDVVPGVEANIDPVSFVMQLD